MSEGRVKTTLSGFWGDQLAKALEGVKVEPVEKGGTGSGHFGHAGRHGEVGGSEPGGVLVGRADVPEASDQFKFSGKARLDRTRGPHVEVSLGGKVKGTLEIHGQSENGRTLKGKAFVKVGSSSILMTHDELHTLRSKMHWVQTANEKDVKSIKGRDVARGSSITIKVGDSQVSVPVNPQSVASIDKAVIATKLKGYSLAAEPKSSIAKSVQAMKDTNPVAVVKRLGFSKAGQLSSFMAHVEHPSDADLKKMLRMKQLGAGPIARATALNIQKQFQEMRATARSYRTQLSGTQAAQYYRRSAILLTNLGRK